MEGTIGGVCSTHEYVEKFIPTFIGKFEETLQRLRYRCEEITLK
jgi:hypothetical protein